MLFLNLDQSKKINNNAIISFRERLKLKNLIVNRLNFKPGRSRTGQITVRHKKSRFNTPLLRLINSKLSVLKNEFAQVLRIEYSSQCSAFLALVRLLKTGFLCYVQLPNNVFVGSFIAINPKRFSLNFFKKINICSSLVPLYKLPRGSFICNFENAFLSGSKFCRSAGTKAKIQSFSIKLGLASVLMPSGKSVFISLNAHGFTGSMSNAEHYLREFFKAGQKNVIGRRSIVRGVAMNPVDHPHGGGEGKTSGGRSSVTPWGKLTKGLKTVSGVKKKKNLVLKSKFLSFKNKI